MKPPYFNNLFWIKFGIEVRLANASRISVAYQNIICIIFCGPNPQVRRITAGRVVARVKNHFAVWYRSKSDNVSKAMSLPRFLHIANHSISILVSTSHPNPALLPILFFHQIPKSFFQRWVTAFFRTELSPLFNVAWKRENRFSASRTLKERGRIISHRISNRFVDNPRARLTPRGNFDGVIIPQSGVIRG